MTNYLQNIETITLKNEHFRQVLYTSQHLQLVVMSLKPNESIGMETHAVTDQFLRIEVGEGKVIMNGEEKSVSAGDAFVVPAGTEHNVINTSTKNPLKLYTIYAPPHHKDKTMHATKAAAEADTEDHL
jgi:mannose-6-phosphate isomerase-like protein (cupin superfamily)